LYSGIKSVDIAALEGSSYLHIWYIYKEYRSSSHIKVIGSRSRSQEQNKSKSNVKLRLAKTPDYGSIKHRAMKFACSMGFTEMADQWCDCHLCDVTFAGGRSALD